MKKTLDIYISDTCTLCKEFKIKLKDFQEASVNQDRFDFRYHTVEKVEGVWKLEGRNANIPGVPALYIDGKLIVGDKSLEYLNGEKVQVSDN